MGESIRRTYRSKRGTDDPWTAGLRWRFMAALEDQWPEAGAELDRLAGPAFDALAEWFEEHAAHQGEIWTVDWPTSDCSDPVRRPPGTRNTAVTPPVGGGAPAASPRGVDDPHLRSAVLKTLRGDEAMDVRRSLEAKLQRALLEWVQARLRPARWILDYCVTRFQERREGQRHNAVREPLRLAVFVARVSHESVPARKPRAYRPEQETRADYRAYVEEYMSQRETAYERAGWELAPERRIGSNLDRDADERRLRWLVQNILGSSYEDLEESEGVDKGTIGREIRKIAKDLRLELHRGR